MFDAPTTIVSMIAILTGMIATWGEYHPARTAVYVFKPLTTALLILLAFIGGHGSAYMWYVVAGLACSLAGDIFMIRPEEHLTSGLMAFLLAHILYVLAFTSGVGFAFTWWFVPLALVGIAIHVKLHDHLGNMRFPVIIYTVVILVMSGTALRRWSILETTGTLLAAIGALSFVVSDMVLAFDHFRKKFSSAQAIVLATYWLAQWCIALSVQ